MTDLTALGERQITIDCDVLQADGGTRTAAITGGYVALYRAFAEARGADSDRLPSAARAVAAVSCGIVGDAPVLDLDYAEDDAETDANFVLTGTGGIVEIQVTAEQSLSPTRNSRRCWARAQGVAELFALQRKALRLD